ncbi:PepSY domain-containing protein [Candidatus Epulonipiscium viviparus]|nr:PepSY domain-containing protein [Candidatus Epulopiscium viviparus]
MNKKFLVVALALAMSSTVFAAAGSTAGYISKSQAKSIALSNAGVNASDATFVKTEIDTENGKHEIDIEFFVQSTVSGIPVYKEYDYDLNAFTGEIISRDVDIEGFNDYTVDTDWDGVDDRFDDYNNNANTKYISESNAKQIALAHARINAADATFVKTELDRDDAEIEVEFFVKTTINGIPTYKEYDYNLNAITGAILSADIDIENFNDKDDDDWDDDDRYDWDDDDDDD